MYKLQQNPAALRSQELICGALRKLMAQLPFAEITVTRICQEAGVGRKTFYRNFERKEDVVERMIDELLTRYTARLAELSPEEQAAHHFTFLAEQIDFLILLYRAGMHPLVAAKFAALRPVLFPTWSENEAEQAYRSAVVAAGTEAVIRLWVERDFQESVEELTRLYGFAIGGQGNTAPPA